MNAPKPLIPIALAICFLLSGGCVGRREYREGVEAEKRGEAHIAYAYFAQAAQRNPDNATYARSIRRLAPTAATFWMSDARLAQAEGRYTDAWKSCMRCLMIQPDRKEALDFLESLTAKHGRDLAIVERDWQRNGAAILAIQQTPSDASVAKTQSPPQVSNAGPAATKKPAPKRPKTLNQRLTTTSTNKPAPFTNRDKRKNKNARSNDAELTFVLSKDNDKYKRQVTTVDGLTIELTGTSSDFEAEFDLYDGERRIQKVRDLRAGRSKLLLTPKGRWFRLSLESVDDESETVSFRLNPA